MLEERQLFAPTGKRIVGIRAQDGTVRTFEYSYDPQAIVSTYVLDDGTSIGQGPAVLVDEEGRDWPSSEVEYYTLFQRRT